MNCEVNIKLCFLFNICGVLEVLVVVFMKMTTKRGEEPNFLKTF